MPPHCSNKLQPLDLSVFGPFKSAINRAIEQWHIANPGQSLTIYHMAGIIATAYGKSFTYQNITSGFRAAGIFPFNDDIYSDDDFYTHFKEQYNDKPILIDVEQPVGEKKNTGQVKSPIPGPSNVQNHCTNTATPLPENSNPIVTPGTSKSGSSSSSFVTPNQLFGTPTAGLQIERRESDDGKQKQRKGESSILTSTPEIEKKKTALMEKQKKEAEKVKRAEERALKKIEKDQKRILMAEQKKKAARTKKSTSTKRKLNFNDQMLSVCKKKSRQEESSDDSSNENGDHVTSSSDSDLESFSSLENQQEPDTIGKDDYVLVRFVRNEKKRLPPIHYVAQIIEEPRTQKMFYVSFLRKKKDGRFSFPDAEKKDEASISEEDIVMKLPKPQNSGSTARQGRHLYFPSLETTYSYFKIL